MKLLILMLYFFIFRQETKEAKFKSAECLKKLGEVGLESGMQCINIAVEFSVLSVKTYL
jgi:preprotein translocase subunit YajC